jgi:hypothetical protein
MIVVRNVFKVKFGKAREAMEAYKEVAAIAKQSTSGAVPMRLLTDVTGSHYTIVSELTFENLAAIDKLMTTITGEVRWQAAYQKFVPCVDSGHREIFKLVD